MDIASFYYTKHVRHVARIFCDVDYRQIENTAFALDVAFNRLRDEYPGYKFPSEQLFDSFRSYGAVKIAVLESAVGLFSRAGFAPFLFEEMKDDASYAQGVIQFLFHYAFLSNPGIKTAKSTYKASRSVFQEAVVSPIFLSLVRYMDFITPRGIRARYRAPSDKRIKYIFDGKKCSISENEVDELKRQMVAATLGTFLKNIGMRGLEWRNLSHKGFISALNEVIAEDIRQRLLKKHILLRQERLEDVLAIA